MKKILHHHNKKIEHSGFLVVGAALACVGPFSGVVPFANTTLLLCMLPKENVGLALLYSYIPIHIMNPYTKACCLGRVWIQVSWLFGSSCLDSGKLVVWVMCELR